MTCRSRSNVRTSPGSVTTASSTRAAWTLTASDQSTAKIGIGVAAVQVGRAVDAVTYRTTGEDLTEILTPAIDASAARLRTALARAAV